MIAKGEKHKKNTEKASAILLVLFPYRKMAMINNDGNQMNYGAEPQVSNRRLDKNISDHKHHVLLLERHGSIGGEKHAEKKCYEY
jgi:hypothetical protein